ncbi:hypothetical protein BBJ28_00005075 [Nothophytophthora sp. Chile5]|nr:hypothetical protein BBJ28_00005075 [Nothophytophthora sp. Chile5]
MGCVDEHGEKTKDAASGMWYLGVILSIVGSVCTNMGVNLQKFSFMREAKRRCVADKRSYVRQPLWVVGLALVIGGSALDFVALGFLPQSLATPVGGSTMVANVAFASLFLKEKFTRGDAIGTTLVLAGICIVAAFANKESACYTVDELVDLYREPLFAVYAVLMGISCVALFLLSKKMERVLKQHGRASPAYKRFAKLHPVSYPALSGIFGAQSVLFAKSVAELMKTTIEGDNQFVTFGAYAIAFSMFACVFLQIHWLAHGLQHFDAVFVVPVFQCFFISVSIFGGGVYFKEFARMKPLALAMFSLGAAITLGGVFQLARRDMHKLGPRGRMRAAVSMVRFIIRCQKARRIEPRWVEDSADGGPATTPKKQAARQEPCSSPSTSRFTGQRSKASVLPVGSSSTTTMSASTSSSVIPEPSAPDEINPVLGSDKSSPRSRSRGLSAGRRDGKGTADS